MRALARAAAAALWLGACGSKEEKPKETPPPAAPTADTPGAPAPSAGSTAWEQLPTAGGSKPRRSYRDHYVFDDPPPIGDPDATIERLAVECPAGTRSAACDELRLQVERIFLVDLIALRDAKRTLDRAWYRGAASARTPQLACIAARELKYATDRSKDDDAALLVALESPAPSVREVVIAAGPPALEAIWPRVVRPAPSTGMCIEDAVDAHPGIEWAGGYPGARYRYFASDSSRRWFTTTDPVDKVLAYFAAQGRAGQTAEQIAAANAQLYQAESLRIMEETKEGEEDKFVQAMQEVGKNLTDPSAPFRNMLGAGEIRYVMIADGQAVAIFKDELLQATSIVAAAPIQRQ